MTHLTRRSLNLKQELYTGEYAQWSIHYIYIVLLLYLDIRTFRFVFISVWNLSPDRINQSACLSTRHAVEFPVQTSVTYDPNKEPEHLPQQTQLEM